MPTPDAARIARTLKTGRAAEQLREIGERFGCVVHIVRIFGKKRWSYVAGDTGGDMLSQPWQRLPLNHGFGAILFPRRPLDAYRLQQLAVQLNTFLETIDR